LKTGEGEGEQLQIPNRIRGSFVQIAGVVLPEVIRYLKSVDRSTTKEFSQKKRKREGQEKKKPGEYLIEINFDHKIIFLII
jgi:hypothetical protein